MTLRAVDLSKTGGKFSHGAHKSMALQRLRVVRMKEGEIYYVHCIERISLSRAPTNGMVMGRLWQIYNIGRLRRPVPWANNRSVLNRHLK
jgi:hypothetical protein